MWCDGCNHDDCEWYKGVLLLFGGQRHSGTHGWLNKEMKGKSKEKQDSVSDDGMGWDGLGWDDIRGYDDCDGVDGAGDGEWYAGVLLLFRDERCSGTGARWNKEIGGAAHRPVSRMRGVIQSCSWVTKTNYHVRVEAHNLIITCLRRLVPSPSKAVKLT